MTKIKLKQTEGTEVSISQIPRQAIVREEILGITSQKEKGYVNLALLLYEEYTSKYHVSWGFPDFKTYSEIELGTKYRKAMNFVEIGEKVDTLGLSKQRIEAIGWTKLRLIVSIMNKDNIDEWLKKAEDNNYYDLQEAARRVRVENGDLAEKPKTTILNLKMSEAEAGVIESAITEAKNLTNSDNTVVALEMVCSDWLEFKGATPQKAVLKDHIAYLEKVYACKIIIQDEEEVTDVSDIDKIFAEELVENAPEPEIKSQEKIEKESIEEVKQEDTNEKASQESSAKKIGKRKPKVKKEKTMGEQHTMKMVTGDKELDALLGL